MRTRVPGILLAFSIFVIQAHAIGCFSEYAGCARYDNRTAEATSCRLFREGVWEFVEVSESVVDRLDRVESLKHLVELLERTPDFDSVRSIIEIDSLATGFGPIFARQLRMAENLPNEQSVDLYQAALCGMKHGLHDWFDNLKNGDYSDD